MTTDDDRTREPGTGSALDRLSQTKPVQAQVARRLRDRRRAVGLSLAEVEARLSELGVRMGVSAVNKVELGTRGVDVDELVALALVLGTNPTALVLPVGETATVALTPGREVDTVSAACWFGADTDYALPDDWIVPADEREPVRDQPLWWYRQHARLDSVRRRATERMYAAVRADPGLEADMREEGFLSSEHEDVAHADDALVRHRVAMRRRGWALPGNVPAHVEAQTLREPPVRLPDVDPGPIVLRTIDAKEADRG